MRILFTLLFLLLVFLVMAAFLGALAVGIGYLLIACVPGLSVGDGIIAGAVVATASAFFLAKLFRAVPPRQGGEDDLEDDHGILILTKDMLSRRRGRRPARRKR